MQILKKSLHFPLKYIILLILLYEETADLNKKTVNLIIYILLLAVAAGLAVLEAVKLPATLVMQVTLSGTAGTTMPKALGLIVVFVFSAVFASLFYFSQKGKVKNLVFYFVGLILYYLIYIMNVKV